MQYYLAASILQRAPPSCHLISIDFGLMLTHSAHSIHFCTVKVKYCIPTLKIFPAVKIRHSTYTEANNSLFIIVPGFGSYISLLLLSAKFDAHYVRKLLPRPTWLG